MRLAALNAAALSVRPIPRTMLSFSLRIAVEAGQQPPVVQLLLQRVVVSALPHLPEHRDDPGQDDDVERRDQEQEEPGQQVPTMLVVYCRCEPEILSRSPGRKGRRRPA